MNLFRLYKGYSVRLRSGYVKLLRALGVQSRAVVLPYDNTNPVIYVKDDPINCYTDDYVMALASAGDIRLVGMVTSSSVAPFNNLVTPEDYERFVVQRVEGIMHAKNSGFRNIPDPVRGPKGHLEKPASGKIEDTQPLGSEGSRLVVNEAKKATSDKPLLLIVCTGLTVHARQATPGDHKRKLQPETVEHLDALFSNILAEFGYK